MSQEINKAKVYIPIVVISAAALWTAWKIVQAMNRKRKSFRFRSMQDREIHVINSPQDWARLYPLLKEQCETIKAVGFDCEWVFWGQRLPVALIQIATYDGLCLLIRIFQMTDCIPTSLKKFLADKSILKLGVSCRDDGRKLFTDYGLSVSGCVDLRHIVGRVRGYHCNHQGLQGLAKTILNVNMTKDRRIRCGDWEAETLTDDQINYAADDAIYAVDMFMQLVAVKAYSVERKSSYYGNSVNADEELFWKSARSLCQGVVDVVFKSPKSSAAVKEEIDEEAQIQQPQSNDISVKPGKHKDSYKAYMTRKRPLYYNCRLLAPDGKCLTQCDIKKANWYVDKGLGVKVSDDPVTIQLNFEPTKRMATSEYRLQERKNLCCVCGATDDYMRRLIVPLEYRRYFPPNFQDHIAHDVLLICLACHHKSAVYETALRQRLARQCDAPLQDFSLEKKSKGDQSLQSVVSAAKALQSKKYKIPEKRRAELEGVIKTYYNELVVTEDLLKMATEVDYRFRKHDHTPHGKKVVMHYMEQEGGLLKFIKMWRQQFVETMEPKYLPDFWSVDHNPEELWNSRQLDDKEKISDDPVVVKLKFEPAKRPASDQDYYLQDKENVCVVCGASDHYIRKLIVPQEYRKYFPPLLKDHSSHDVLLMCLSCHQKSSLYDTALRQRLAQECDAPMDSGTDTKTKQDRDLQKIVSIAKALRTSRDKIPAQRIMELEETIKNFYGVSSINEELLKQAQDMDYKVHDADHTPHGKKVVMHYMKEKGGLLEFEKMWRRQFLETMQPQFLPYLWSVDHKPERMMWEI